MKHCSQCGETKDETEFYVNRTKRDGLEGRCRACFKIASAAYYVIHKADVTNRVQAYNEAHSAELKSHRRTLSSRYLRARGVARRRGLGWKLSLAEYAALIQDNQCHYCSNPLPEMGTGLDRKENHGRGYSLDNVVPCCTRCNAARGNWFTYEEFVRYIAPAIRACDAAAKVCQLAMTRSFDGYVVTAGIDGYVVTAEGIVRPSLVNDEWR